MAYDTIPTRTTSNTNSSADINQLQLNTVGVYVSASTNSTQTLTVTSPRRISYTASGAHDVVLPSTSITAGDGIWIENRSTSNVITVKSSDGDVKATLLGSAGLFYPLQATPTDKTHWRLVDYRATDVHPKQYIVGNTYNGVSLTITCPNTNFTVVRGVLIPWMTSDGAWRVKINFTAVQDGSGTDPVITIAGITSKNVALYYQSLFQGHGTTLEYTYSQAANALVVPPNSNVFTMHASSVSTAEIVAFGEIELESRPTWADPA